MSTYQRFTKHPKTGKWENATWIDDYYERHHYGVQFPDGTVYDPWGSPIITNINAEEAATLNAAVTYKEN